MLHLPSASSPPPSNNSKHVQLGTDWLRQIVTHLKYTMADNVVVVNETMRNMINMSDQVLDGDKYDDTVIWIAGLQLIHDIIANCKLKSMCDDPIEPHVLLSTLLDSYYRRDVDCQFDDIQQHCGLHGRKLSSTHAMFCLRLVLATIAIEKSVECTRSSMESSETIRWRRLKSMIDDVVSLFKKMLLNQLDLEHESESSTAETQNVITMATYIYVEIMFPSCRELLQLLLENVSDAAFMTRTLQTSHTFLASLTSLSALQFIFGEGEVASSSVLQMIMGCINDPFTDNLFQLMKRNALLGNDGNHDKQKRFCLWKNETFQRGSHFIEGLLLYPTICVHAEYIMISSSKNENGEEDYDDDSDGSLEDEQQDALGTSVIAYCILTSSSPFPYSKQYLWALFFPHVHIFLRGLNSTSSTLKLMNEVELDNTNAIICGLGILKRMITSAPAVIEPNSCNETSESDESVSVYYAIILEASIDTLLSTVMRLSMFEAATHNNPTTNTTEYSSRQVMDLIQKLLVLHKPITRINSLVSLAQKMKYTQHTKVLLPRVLDWVRPVVMMMSVDFQIADVATVSDDDIDVIQSVISGLTPFLHDLECTFDKSKHPLPNDIPEFMSMVETYTSLLSVFHAVRAWLYRSENIVLKKSDCRGMDDSFNRIKSWVLENETMLKSFSELLADLIDFWSRACSPRDAKVCVGNNMEPPLGWHRLFLLSHALQDSLLEFKVHN